MELLWIAITILAAGVSIGYAYRGTMHKELGTLKAEVYSAIVRLDAMSAQTAGTSPLAAVKQAQMMIADIAAGLRKKL